MLQRKMLRDLWVQKTSFLSIFLLMLMGSYIFSGITSEYNGMQVYMDRFMDECHMADATIYASELPVLDATYTTQADMLVSGQIPGDDTVSLQINIIQENTLSQMKLMEGEAYAPEKHGVWIDASYASSNNLQLHDTFQFQIGDMQVSQEILGFVLSPAYIYQIQENQMVSDHQKSGYVYINKDSISIPFQANKLLVKSEDPNLKNNLLKVSGDQSRVVMKEDDLSYSMLQDEITQHKELGLIFALTFLGIALLVSITTIHRLLQTQQQQIGILKAFGFSKKRLYLHYTSHCAWITFVAVCTGSALGLWTFSAITYPFMKEMYTLPDLASSPIFFTYLLPFLCTLVSILISLQICHRYLVSSAASILSGKQPHHKLSSSLQFTIPHTSFITQWNLRDILRNRLRSFMSIFGVVGCTALLIGAFGIYTTIVQLSDWTFSKQETYNCKVSGSFDEVLQQQLITSMQGDEVMSSLITLKTNQGEEQVSLTALSDTRFIHLALNMDSFTNLENGVAISKNIAEQYHIQTGDQITWKLLGSDQWQSNQVEAIIRTPLSQGVTIMKDQLIKQQLPFTTTSIVGQIPNTELLSNPQITSVQYHEDLIHNIDTMMDATVMMIAVFSIAAILLGSVILYNLGSLAYMERSYELSTLKVLGFQDKSVRKIMIQQNLWLTIAGVLLGIPAGYWLLDFMLATIQSTMDVMMYVPLTVVLGASFGTLLLSFLIILIISRKIKSIDMVAALKANE